ncbi:MAG: RpiR family transcriptional regulator [Acidimicrobiaceae bacterium]|nr:MAG: RpiR family transcriptional regulator [Acidimicrobiaceae bacterium]
MSEDGRTAVAAAVSSAPVEAADRIGELGPTLTRAERRVAEVVLERPQLVAFGTVAELAAAAEAGAATVVRLATKLGFDGFTTLQASIQHDLANQLRPAAERIREPVGSDIIGRHLQLEVANVQSSLRSIDPAVLADIVGHLAAASGRVFVLSGDASRGVAAQLVGDLGALRDDVTLLDGNDIAVRRQLVLLRPTDVVLTLDLRRYERWVVDAARAVADAGVWSVAVTDSVLSPLAASANRSIVVAAAGGGPFDSHAGTLAVFNLLVTGVADQLRAVATERLDRMETAWRNAFTDR